jgi:hypothetical protein
MKNCETLGFSKIPQPAVNSKVAKVGGLQSQGVKGEAVIYYRNPLIPPTAGLDLKSSGFPAG